MGRIQTDRPNRAKNMFGNQESSETILQIMVYSRTLFLFFPDNGSNKIASVWNSRGNGSVARLHDGPINDEIRWDPIRPDEVVGRDRSELVRVRETRERDGWEWQGKHGSILLSTSTTGKRLFCRRKKTCIHKNMTIISLFFASAWWRRTAASTKKKKWALLRQQRLILRPSPEVGCQSPYNKIHKQSGWASRRKSQYRTDIP